MDLKRLAISVAVLAVLIGVLVWSNKQEEGGEKKASADDPPKIVDVPMDQVARIEIRRSGAEPVLLERGTQWTIKAPKAMDADQEAVANLASTLAALQSERMLDAKPADVSQYGMQDPVLTAILTAKDNKTYTVKMGGDSPTGASTYAMREGDPRLFTIASYTKTALDKSWRDLRDKRLLRVESDSLTRVELNAKGTAIEFGKNNAGNWTILKPKPLRADHLTADQLIRKLSGARLEVINDTEEEAVLPKKFAAASVIATARLTDQQGTHQIEIRKGKDNEYFAKSSALEGVYKTTPELGEGVDKKLEDFRNRKLFEFSFAEPEKVEVKDGDKSHAFTKSGNEWKRDGKNVEPSGVQQVIDRLRDLSATRFADAAQGNAVAEYVVNVAGKAAERVIVRKQGDVYHAQRANEPEVFVLDGTVVSGIRDLAAGVKEATPPPAQPPAKK
jgi:hypothetical protein